MKETETSLEELRKERKLKKDVSAFEFRVGERAIVEFGRWSSRDQIASGKID